MLLVRARKDFIVSRTTEQDHLEVATAENCDAQSQPVYQIYQAAPALSARTVVIIDGPGMDMQICEFESNEAATFYVATLNQVYSRGQVEARASGEIESADVWSTLGALVQTLRKEISLEPAQTV
jgi:hypothetical protein